MRNPFRSTAIALGLGLFSLSNLAFSADQVNVICSVQAEWCNMISTVYARTSGTKLIFSMMR